MSMSFTITDMVTRKSSGRRRRQGKPRITPKGYDLYIGEHADAADISDIELSEEIGTTRTTIFRWRTGQRRPDPEEIKRIAKALRIEPEKLLSRPADRPSLDAMLRGVDDVTFEKAAELLRIFIKN